MDERGSEGPDTEQHRDDLRSEICRKSVKARKSAWALTVILLVVGKRRRGDMRGGNEVSDAREGGDFRNEQEVELESESGEAQRAVGGHDAVCRGAT